MPTYKIAATFRQKTWPAGKLPIEVHYYFVRSRNVRNTLKRLEKKHKNFWVYELYVQENKTKKRRKV